MDRFKLIILVVVLIFVGYVLCHILIKSLPASALAGVLASQPEEFTGGYNEPIGQRLYSYLGGNDTYYDSNILFTKPNIVHNTLHNTVPNTLHNTVPNTLHTVHNTPDNTVHNKVHNTLDQSINQIVSISDPVNDLFGKNKIIGINSGYDEYDDKELLIDQLPEYMKDIKYIVIDGNNLIYQLMTLEKQKAYYDKNLNSKAINYRKHLAEAVELCCKTFKESDIIFVIKDVYNKNQEYNYEDLVKCNNVTIVVSSGKLKARDDFTVIYFAELLPEGFILLTRDRFRDVKKTSMHEPDSNKIYGKNVEKYTKMLKKTTDHFSNIGSWSFNKKLMGYTFSDIPKKGVWKKRKNKNSEASELVFVF